MNSQKRAAEEAWAGNSYYLAGQSGNVSVDNARAEVQIAQQRLDEFYREKEAKTSRDDLSGFTDGEEGFNDGETHSNTGGRFRHRNCPLPFCMSYRKH